MNDGTPISLDQVRANKQATESVLSFGRSMMSLTDSLIASSVPGFTAPMLRPQTSAQMLEASAQRSRQMPVEMWTAIVSGIKNPSVATLEWLCRFDNPNAEHWNVAYNDSANTDMGMKRREDRRKMGERFRAAREAVLRRTQP